MKRKGKQRPSREAWTRDLTLIECNRRRWDVLDTSYRDRATGKTHDLFQFIDCLAFPEGGGTVAIQYTSADHVSHRRAKIMASPNLPLVLRGGWRVVIWGWREDGRLREEEILDA